VSAKNNTRTFKRRVRQRMKTTGESYTTAMRALQEIEGVPAQNDQAAANGSDGSMDRSDDIYRIVALETLKLPMEARWDGDTTQAAARAIEGFGRLVDNNNSNMSIEDALDLFSSAIVDAMRVTQDDRSWDGHTALEALIAAAEQDVRLLLVRPVDAFAVSMGELGEALDRMVAASAGESRPNGVAALRLAAVGLDCVVHFWRWNADEERAEDRATRPRRQIDAKAAEENDREYHLDPEERNLDPDAVRVVAQWEDELDTQQQERFVEMAGSTPWYRDELTAAAAWDPDDSALCDFFAAFAALDGEGRDLAVREMASILSEREMMDADRRMVLRENRVPSVWDFIERWGTWYGTMRSTLGMSHEDAKRSAQDQQTTT